ncbi:MAG: Fic family protein [Nitrosopumilus sp.]|nr:Fic family protein [Nitrosopumilus sp.]
MQRTEPHNKLPDLPPKADLESPEFLKASIKASRLLAELKGYCQTLPNPTLLINTIVLQESKDSSAIENIVTTQDELYRAVASLDDGVGFGAATKEVLLYREALYHGQELMKTRGLTTNTLVAIMRKLKNTDEGIRKTTGTRLANPITKEIIYTPPEGEVLIREKLAALEKFIHNDKDDIDVLIKMALIHYQFEAIHPFSDGNGRTGRILNVLYLVNKNLLNIPVLYLSSYIIQKKGDYYRLLRDVTENNNWKGWILFMLEAVAETAAITLAKIDAIQSLKKEIAIQVKGVLKSSFNAELVDLMFSFPYLKIKILETHDIAQRQTASVYLQKLATAGILHPMKSGKEMYYINHRLMSIFS